MLDHFSSGVRFSREYALLLLRYLSELYPTISYPNDMEQLDKLTLNKCLRTSTAALPDASYGLEIGRRLHICDFGIIGYAALNSNSLKDAAQTSIRYRSLLVKGISTHIRKDGDNAEYVIETDTTNANLWPIIEFEMAAAVRFIRLSTHPKSREAITIRSVRVQHPPLARLSLYEEVFGCIPTFNAPTNSVMAHRTVLKQATQNPNGLLFKILDDRLSAGLTETNSEIPLSQRVQAYLRAVMPRNFPTQQEVASHFCLSVSGLKRRLREEGYSYRSLFDEQRFRLAEKALSESSDTSKTIGYSLGFSDQSAFNRAFKRWSGKTPLEFRESVLNSANQQVI